ncbi:MAG TPA: aldo/keto reductase [Terriglobales bacterium]|nr:aldo/keto reductase [Terriglobales bacterium]
MPKGHATAEGTERYSDRFPQLRAAGHFRRAEQISGVSDLWLSSIGLGTYLGEPDDATDQAYIEAIVTALRSGINLLDTAINYRHQRSERNIGAALAQLFRTGELNRDEVFICTKAGYLSLDGAMPEDPRGYFAREYIEPGILDPKQLAGGMHCMAPVYLENQIERSRRNLGVETIDLFYVHNPESQLSDISREMFHQRLQQAFVMLEQQVKAGKLRYYGLATWNGFRVAEDAREHLNLFDVVKLAQQAGGDDHHFRFVQLPFNLAMTEAYALANQTSGKEKMSLLAAASSLGVAVIGSATLYQSRLTHGLPDFVGQTLGMNSDAENAIQFSRSTPGLTSSLIGMRSKEHVHSNLKAAPNPITPLEQWSKLFTQR